MSEFRQNHSADTDYIRRDNVVSDERSKSVTKRRDVKRVADLDEMIRTATAQLSAQPGNIDALLLRGGTLIKKGMSEEGIKDLNLVLKRDHNNVEAVYNRAIGLSNLTRYEEAIVDLNTALSINPQHTKSIFARAACYNKIGQFDQAIDDYNIALFHDLNGNTTASPSPPSPSHGDDFAWNDGNGNNTQTFDDNSPSGFSAASYGRGMPSSPMVRGGRFSNYHAYSPMPPQKTQDLNNVKELGSVTNNLNTTTRGRALSTSSQGSNWNSVGYFEGDTKVSVSSTDNKRLYVHTPASAISSSNSLYSQFHTGGSATPISMHGEASGGFNTAGTSSSSSSAAVTQKQAQADEHYTKGYQLRKQNDFRGAIVEYSKALQVDSRHFKALFNRGFAYDKLGQFDNAITDYSRAVEIEPNNAFCFYNRAISNDRRGTLDQACADFTRAIALDGNNADFFYNRALCLRKQNKFAVAVEDYNVTLKMNPSHVKALYNRAICHEKLDNVAASLHDCEAALKLQPAHSGVLLLRAQLNERGNRIQAAIADYTTVLQGTSGQNGGADVLAIYTARAKLWPKVQNFEATIEDLTKIIELLEQAGDKMGPSSTAVQGKLVSHYFTRGMSHKALGTFASAAADFSYVVEQDPKQVAAYSNRAFCYRKLQKLGLALSDYSRVVELQPDNLRAYNNRAYIFASMERFQEAADDYSTVIRFDPTSSHAYHNRGISYDKLGKLDLAIADFTKVMELEPHFQNDPAERRKVEELKHNITAMKQELQLQQHVQQVQQKLASASVSSSPQPRSPVNPSATVVPAGGNAKPTATVQSLLGLQQTPASPVRSQLSASDAGEASNRTSVAGSPMVARTEEPINGMEGKDDNWRPNSGNFHISRSAALKAGEPTARTLPKHLERRQPTDSNNGTAVPPQSLPVAPVVTATPSRWNRNDLVAQPTPVRAVQPEPSVVSPLSGDVKEESDDEVAPPPPPPLPSAAGVLPNSFAGGGVDASRIMEVSNMLKGFSTPFKPPITRESVLSVGSNLTSRDPASSAADIRSTTPHRPLIPVPGDGSSDARSSSAGRVRIPNVALRHNQSLVHEPTPLASGSLLVGVPTRYVSSNNEASVRDGEGTSPVSEEAAARSFSRPALPMPISSSSSSAPGPPVRRVPVVNISEGGGGGPVNAMSFLNSLKGQAPRPEYASMGTPAHGKITVY